VEACRRGVPVLEEVPERAILAASDPAAPSNHLIEADNFAALSVLSGTHAGKVDLIYIDPPYNTGNKDFIYNDRYVDAEDAYRHSKWLSFMERRLALAWGLLADTGAIFISIDDDEHAHLKVLCDQVFGPQAFIANIVWQKKYTQSNDARFFSDTHDFILCYAKRDFVLRRLRRTAAQDSRYANPDDDPRGPWQSMPLHARSGSNGDFSYTFKNGVTWRAPP
jgi:adenine-specific DNA-methyltransferase